MGKKPVFELDVKINKSYFNELKLLSEWPKRLKSIEPMISYMGANYIKQYVQSKLPKSSTYKGYRSSLELVRVKGMQPEQYAYTVQVNTKNSFVKDIKVKSTLLYVESNGRLTTKSRKIEILEQYGPWTYDTLPFTPDKKEARLVTKRVSSREVSRVALQRAKDRPKWRAELNKEGVRENKKDKRLKLPKSVSSLPDVALNALKLEFGLGGQKPKPAWRLGFSMLARQGFKSFIKDKRLFAFPLTRPSYNLWKKWPEKTPRSISTAQARKYKNFQRKVVGNS